MENKVKKIIHEKGGYREKRAFKSRHELIIKQWDNNHKVVEIRPFNFDIPGCQIDLETNLIVG